MNNSNTDPLPKPAAPEPSELRRAAQALVERWDTPNWKEVEHTAVFINRLRAALAAPTCKGDPGECEFNGACMYHCGAAPVPAVVEIDAYALPAKRQFDSEIKIQRTRQIEGPALWKVSLNGECLNKSGEWEWEPRPSSRDDDFLARCRFATAQEAIDAALASVTGSEQGPTS